MRTLLTLSLLALTGFLALPAHATSAQPTVAGVAAFHAADWRPEVLPQEAPPTPLEEVVGQLAEALSGRQWSLALCLLVVALVVVLRKVASVAGNLGEGPLSELLLWLSTPKGAVALAVTGGTATLLSVALSGGQPISLGLLISCFLGAASASGLFSWGQTLVRPKSTAVPVCSPEEIANGTCRV